MRRIAAGFAVAALLMAVAGCPTPQRLTELENEVETQSQRIIGLEEMVETLEMERDSLKEAVIELSKRQTPARTPSPAPGGREALPPTRK